LCSLRHWLASVLDNLRSALARLIVRHLRRPRPLAAHAWLWLAGQAEDIEDKRRCLEAVLQLDPENETAS